MPLTVRKEYRPCVECGEEFEPDEAYLVDGPRHVGCTPFTEPDLCETWRCDRPAGHDGPCTWRR